MQPYFLPYIGYFQLINSVDEFIIYDNIQYTKKGWINRNRILFDNKDRLITLPIKKDSDFLNVIDRELSDVWEKEKKDILNLIKISYKNAPNFVEGYELLLKCFNTEEINLFKFIYNSIIEINNYLDIKTKITISSSINIDHNLKSQDKVVALCLNKKTKTYINSIGGVELYDKKTFKDNNLELKFIKSNLIEYNQFNNKFIPWLSIVDVIMFNSKDEVKKYLNKYELI